MAWQKPPNVQPNKKTEPDSPPADMLRNDPVVEEARAASVPKELWTMGGKPIPPELLHLVTFRHTDQGIEEFNRGKEVPRVTVTSEPFDKIVNAPEGIEPWETPNPLKDAAAPYARDGFRQRWLSPMRVEQAGMRKWKPVRDERGDLVRMRKMFLAEMPEEMAERRQQACRDEAKAQYREASESFSETQNRLAHDNRDSGVTVLKQGEEVRNVENGQVVTAGVHTSRGPSSEIVR